MGVCTTINDLVWVAIFALMNATAIIVGQRPSRGRPSNGPICMPNAHDGGRGGCRRGAGPSGHTPCAGRWSTSFPTCPYPVREKAQFILMLGALTIWFRAFNTINIVGVLSGGDKPLFSLCLDVGTLWLVGA